METKLIFSPQLAKYLILNKNIIVDLKKKKEDNSTIFVFEDTDKLQKDILDWSKSKNT